MEKLNDKEGSTEIVEKRESLSPFAVRLRPDQVEYLKGKPDASEWFRDLIDRAMVEEARATADPETVPEGSKVRQTVGSLDSITSNCNGITEICNGAKLEISRIEVLRAGFSSFRDFEPAIIGSKGRYV